MEKKVMPPYIGAAYYPEVWPREAVDDEIAKMKEVGINCVRVGEFAWSRMEPEEGTFCLDWLQEVCDKMYAAGIAVILCTPSATPPKWLTDKYPETLNVQSGGIPSQFGGRCHVCKSSPVMREKNRLIIERMAQLLGRHPSVIGWQLDNEIFHYGDGCFCPLCQKRFKEYLKKKYGTVGALNESWKTARWSLTYDSFEAVIPPRRDTWNHPSLVAEWLRFQDETIVSYIREQAETVRKFSDMPIGTDMMPMLELSHEKMNEALDVVQSAICKGLEKCFGLKNPEALGTWFYRIVVNEALQYLRKSRKESVSPDGELPEQAYHEPAYERQREVYEEVMRLAEPMKTVVVLHFYEGLTLKQISEVTDTNLNTVKSRLYSALNRLEKGLKEAAI